MRNIVLISHGELAQGMHSVVKMIAGDRKEVYSICLKQDMDAGLFMEECEKAVQLLKSQGYNPGLVNVRFIRPMDEEMLHVLSKKYSLIVTVEENQLIGGYGQMVSAFLHKNVCKNQLLTLGISDYFVGHATVNEQREEAGINADSIVKSIIDRMN